jgi:hypothetical protein
LAAPRDRQLAGKFEVAAWRYCTIIENHQGRAARSLLADLHTAIAELYFRASVLGPQPEGPSEAPPAADEIAHLLWMRLFTSLHVTLGSLAHYRRSFYVDEPGTESPSEGCLADDLADIYLEVRQVIADATCSDTTMLPATIAGWHSAFGYHWGRHANDAMCAIHGLLFRDSGVLEEGDDRVAAAARQLG